MTDATPIQTRQAVGETVFANARLVLPDRVELGRLTVAGDTIAEIAFGPDVPRGAMDLGGEYLAPGLVELHTDNLERHMEPRPQVDWPHEAAILAHDRELCGCGITTVFDALRVGSITSGADGYMAAYAREVADEFLALRQAGVLRISHFVHLRAEICSETLIEELASFGPEDRIGIVSLMDHTPGQRQFRDVSKLRAYHMAKSGRSEADFIEHVASLKELRDEFGDANEAKAVEEARRYGATLASHDDTTDAHVATSAEYGVKLAEFPTTEEAARACQAHGIPVMMGAPNLIRGGSHSGNVAAADLARADFLDILSSDYVPGGLLHGATILGEIWNDLARGIATVTRAPADATGLTDRGALIEGRRADLLRFGIRGSTPVIRATWVRGERAS